MQPLSAKINNMNNEEKKDIPSTQLVNQEQSQIAKRKISVNEDSNKAHGRAKGEIRDETGGFRKNLKDLTKEVEAKKDMSAVEKYTGRKPVEKADTKDLHLKSSTSLTEPETARQNLKGASKANDFGKEKPPSNNMFRGSGGRGGAPTMSEPDEILKKKHDVINPNDILSQQKPQQQQQKSAGKIQEEKPKVNPREWMAKMLEANSPNKKENTKTVTKDTAKANIKGLIDKVVADRNNVPAEKTVSKEKSKDVAMNITKTAPPKTIKR